VPAEIWRLRQWGWPGKVGRTTRDSTATGLWAWLGVESAGEGAQRHGRARPPGARLRRCDDSVGRVSESTSYRRCKRRWRVPWSGNAAGRTPSLPRRPPLAGPGRAWEQEVAPRRVEEGSLK
jgi:hypothetical protein